MARYGIPYMGSKSGIAKKIIDFLPAGNRLVDLFGGGFAISHCALELINQEQIGFWCKKWNKVLYNEIDTVVVNLIKDVFLGKIDFEKPEWISREDFLKRKDIDGLVKTCWSFGNQGTNYMYGKDIEPYKKACHFAIVFDDWALFKKLCPEVFEVAYNALVGIKGLNKRRLAFDSSIGHWRGGFNIGVDNGKERGLQPLQWLQRLESLERLQRLGLEISNLSYKQYEYQDGDVVYCDIPYENTQEYDFSFNHKQFFEWVKTRPFDVYISSYKNKKYETELGLQKVFECEKRSTISATNNSLVRKECIYKHNSTC